MLLRAPMNTSHTEGTDSLKTSQAIDSPKQGCQFFLARKNRRCNFNAVPGSVYCSHHTHASRSKEQGGEVWRECPFGNHFVKAAALNKHIIVCPERLHQENLKGNPYYVLNINSGPSEDQPILSPVPQDLISVCGESTLPRARRHAAAMMLGESGLRTLIEKVDAALSQLNVLISDSFLEAPIPATPPPPHPDPTFVKHTSEKHGSQQASILGNMSAIGLLPQDSSDIVYIEFGAGRGYLTAALVECYPCAQEYIMVDLINPRNAADRGMRHLPIRRIRCDIKDFEPSALFNKERGTSPPSWVAHGKHLCGAALDLSLRCAVRCAEQGQPLVGVALASCCHHRCTWQHFVGKDVWLKQCGLSSAEFELVSWMTGWGLCGHSSPLIQEEHTPVTVKLPEESTPHGKQSWRPHHTLERETRVHIGMQCKKLIDSVRIMWLRGVPFFRDAAVVNYVDPKVCGENKLILAKTLQHV